MTITKANSSTTMQSRCCERRLSVLANGSRSSSVRNFETARWVLKQFDALGCAGKCYTCPRDTFSFELAESSELLEIQRDKGGARRGTRNHDLEIMRTCIGFVIFLNQLQPVLLEQNVSGNEASYGGGLGGAASESVKAVR